MFSCRLVLESESLLLRRRTGMGPDPRGPSKPSALKRQTWTFFTSPLFTTSSHTPHL